LNLTQQRHGQGRPAVFLDRDGTIIEDRGHLSDPSQIVFLPETFDALLRLREQFLLFIVTHQPGIARGLITRKQADRVNRAVVAALAERGIAITDAYVCPHERSQDCACIKPRPYFLEQAAARYSIDLAASFTVGDHPHDVEFALNVGARGIYVLTGHGQKHQSELPPDAIVVPTIAQAAERILDLHRQSVPEAG